MSENISQKDIRLDIFQDTSDKIVLNILVFLDLFDYPPCLFELKKYTNISFSKLLKILNQLTEKDLISEKNGFYFLFGRENILSIRRKRYNYAQRKLKIASRFAKFFSILPFVKMIALVNSIGSYNLKDGGDIDFFIVSSSNRLWISRFFCTGLAKILNSRPNKKNKRDKICLSFYLSENNLNFEILKLPEGDPYFDFWERGLEIIFDRDNISEKLNKPNTSNLFKNKKSKLLNLLDSFLANWQKKIMPPELKKAALGNNFRDGVVIRDDILKFYLSDKRIEIRKKYEEKIRAIVL